MGLLIAKNLSVAFEESKPVLEDVSLIIEKGALTVLLGSSGSGKSTFLRSLAGIQPLTKGSVTINGKNIDTLPADVRVQHLAFVAQDYQLFPHMTVMENCTHPQQKVLGVAAEAAFFQAEKLLKQFCIGHLTKKYPHQLSGGQKQRVAIARGLAMGSTVLLLDEPTSALDPYHTEILANLLKDLRDQGYTIVLSTHNIDFAVMTMDTQLVLRNGKIDVNQNILKQTQVVSI